MEWDQQPLTRRRMLQGAGAGVIGMMSVPAWAQETFDFKVPGGPSIRPITTSFPEKGKMILQRTSPPWLETPFDIYDKSVITPNNQHYVMLALGDVSRGNQGRHFPSGSARRS
jgi:hypothetical protein